MAAALFTNNATTTLASAIVSTSATSLTVSAGTGALFPAPTGSDYFYLSLVDNSNNIEIVQVTARATDLFTIVRGAEGTTARTFATGTTRVELRPTAAGLNSKMDKDGGTFTSAVTFSGTATFSSTISYGGVTLTNQVTGTGKMVLATTPTLTTPVISGALTYGGVALSAAATGTGSMVLSTSPTITTPTVSGALTYGGVALSASCTGTGSMVLATSPTIALANASTTKDSAGNALTIGFFGLPVIAGSAGHTYILSDRDKCFTNTTGGWVIPANGTVAFPVGSLLAGYNNSSSDQTLSITTDTLRLSGTASTGSRTIAQRGYFVVWKNTSTEWVLIGGSGVS